MGRGYCAYCECVGCDGDCLESADFSIGGGWGNAIIWTRPEQFDCLSCDSRLDCHGWKRDIPKVGSTLSAEMERSWLFFEFVEVRRCGDPPDMFFAVVKPLRQVMKDVILAGGGLP